MKFFKNQRGFSHHFLIPIIVVVVIAGIGTYLVWKSHAEPVSSGFNPNTAVGCNSDFNDFKGNGFDLIKGTYYHYLTPARDYEIVLHCGAGGLGHVYYHHFGGSTRLIYGSSDAGVDIGAADIALAPLKNKGFSMAILGQERDQVSGTFVPTNLFVLNFDVHGNCISREDHVNNNVPFDHIRKFYVTGTHPGSDPDVSGGLEINSADIVLHNNATHKDIYPPYHL